MIAGFGLIACVALSLLMKHAIEVKQENDTPRVVVELMNLYGPKFADPAEFRVQARDGEGRLGQLVIFPLLSANRARLVRAAGEYVWRNAEARARFDALVVEADDGLGHRHRYLVPDPQQVGRSMRLLRPEEDALTASKPRRARKPKSKPSPAAAEEAGTASKTSDPGAAKAPTSKPSEPSEPPR